MTEVNLADYVYRKIFEIFLDDFFRIIESERQISEPASLEGLRKIELMRHELLEKITTTLAQDEKILAHPHSTLGPEIISEAFEHCYDELCRFSEATGGNFLQAKEQLRYFITSRLQ